MPCYTGPGLTETKCPYYQSEGKYSITCEGFNNATQDVTRFSSEKGKTEFQKENCYHYPNGCFKAILLDKRYLLEPKKNQGENKTFPGKSTRITFVKGELYYCGWDVAKTLGYKRPNDAVKKHCSCTVKRSIATKQGNKAKMLFIPECDVLRLIAKSKLKSSESFKKIIFERNI